MRWHYRSAAALVVLLLALPGCSRHHAPLANELSAYTDRGDGCPQVVSAISYADTSLKPLGQEQYQTWDEVVRGKLAAVDGTIDLEVRDFPNKDILRQAQTVGRLGAKAAAPGVTGAPRVRALREYRREAAQLVIDCAPYVDSKG
ncbi:MAG: hypothetical protein QOJ90_1618 [Actinomycetota bacterium]|nr:hypothetical protein [Actinomycetota bacterium]